MYAVNASHPQDAGAPSGGLRGRRAAGSDPTLAAVLEDILDTPVSPELLPPKDGEIAQKTEELGRALRAARFLPLLRRPLGLLAPEGVTAWRSMPWGRSTTGQRCLRWLQNFLPPLLRPAVQALLPAGRPEGRLRDPLAPRGLADALGRCRDAVAGRGRALDHLTEKGEGRMALSLSL